MCSKNTVSSINNLIGNIERDTVSWGDNNLYKPWFRGHRENGYKLIPSIFRKDKNHQLPNERELSLMFRNRAGVFGNIPERSGNVDKWLFLMQQFGAHTRLLDWTESPLVGLFFALYSHTDISPKEKRPHLWMLHPLELNKISIKEYKFPNTWSDHKGNVVRHNLSFPFVSERKPTRFPIAIQATYSERVMSSQQSCFTVHGSVQEPFEEIFRATLIKKGFLHKYEIPNECIKDIEKELRILGISHSFVFPDFLGLANELLKRFSEKKRNIAT
jgi:hypothetical protein